MTKTILTALRILTLRATKPKPLAIVGIVLILVGLRFTALADTGASARGVGPTIALEAPCPFSPGWNLAAVNGAPADLPTCVTTAWSYTNTGDGTGYWEFWGRYNPSYWNDLAVLDIRRGYWLYVR